MVTWASDPSFKIESGATDFSSDGLTAAVHRPENAISYAIISANDLDGKNYIANIDAFAVIKVSYRYGAGGWTQVFEGVTERIGPTLNDKQTLELTAYGYGRALRNTHCAGNYGNESEDPLLDTPHEIWDDLIDNQINKRFSGGANTGYVITKDKIAVCANPSINYLEGGYRTNFTVINDILLSYQGYRNGLAGMHWFVDEDGNLFINTIGAHENNASGWPTWWRTDEAGSTLVEGIDFVNTVFHKKLNNFANNVILYCNLRKPGTDVWTEGGGPAWNSFNLGAPTPDYSAVQKVVGDESLRLITNDAAIGYAWHPNNNAGWDLTRIGSPESVPTINFYFWRDADVSAAGLRLCTTDRVNDYYQVMFTTFWTDPADTWIHRSLNVGPYWKTKDEQRVFRWTDDAGAMDWANINSICFLVQRVGEDDATIYIDDLHFAGKVIREAYNSTNITANNEVQKIIRYDVAVDDSLKATDDTGTAAQLAYGELLTRQVIPTVGMITTPLAEDALPGQLIHIHSDEYLTGGGGWRINANFRVKKLIHVFTNVGALTMWDLTSDVLNTFVPGFNDALTTYHKLIHTDPDMKNLKTTGLDPYVTRLSRDYP